MRRYSTMEGVYPKYGSDALKFNDLDVPGQVQAALEEANGAVN